MNKKKNAFTLIELLAIIVILAIIAVITVPIILNVIDSAKEGAAADSAYGYKEAISKYYVSELFSNNKLMLDGTYEVKSDGVLNGNFGVNDSAEDRVIPIDGNKPSGGSLHYTNNVLDGGCLVMGEYQVIFGTDGSVSGIEKGDCSNVNRMDLQFAADSWADIKSNLALNRNYYPIGSTKIIEFDRDDNGVNEYYKVRLANTAPCNGYTGSNTSCGVVIEFVTLVGTHKMNATDTNEGGWSSSDLRSWLNSNSSSSIYSKLNAVIGKDSSNNDIIISTTPVISGSGEGGVSSNTEDYLYLLSGKEVGLSLDYDNKNLDSDDKVLQYYVNNTDDESKIKYSTTTVDGVDSGENWYWLRSAFSENMYSFYYISALGGAGFSFSGDTAWVAPAFRIME